MTDQVPSAVPQEEKSVNVQLLAWAVTNCHMLARRRIRAGVDLEYWEHVQRICEKAGARSKGVLRASLPTEITEGSDKAWHEGNEQAWKDLATDGGLPESRPAVPQEEQDARWFLEREGYRRCDVAACNCGSWHGGHAMQRLTEIEDALTDAGIEMNGKTILQGVRELAASASSSTAQNEWRPIETASKKIHDRVLLWWTTRGACSGYFDIDGDRNRSGWRGDQDLVIPRDQHRCTHWMPLPSPPQDAPAPPTPSGREGTQDR
jgi:hypothetical protein